MSLPGARRTLDDAMLTRTFCDPTGIAQRTLSLRIRKIYPARLPFRTSRFLQANLLREFEGLRFLPAVQSHMESGYADSESFPEAQ